MRDRSNVFIQQEKVDGKWIGIGLYSHWGGPHMQQVAVKAAEKSADRLGDPAYFARRVIHLILNEMDPWGSETGHGLWTRWPCDNEYPILVINALSGHVWTTGENNFREDEEVS